MQWITESTPIGRALKTAQAYGRLVPEALYRARLSVCLGGDGRPPCENWQPILQSCRICHCPMKVSARLEAKDCPIGRWPAA